MKLRPRKAHRFTIGVIENENGTVKPRRKLIQCWDAISDDRFEPFDRSDLKDGVPGFCGSCAIVKMIKRVAKIGRWPHKVIDSHIAQVQAQHAYVANKEINSEIRGAVHWLHDGAEFIEKYDTRNGKQKLLDDWDAGLLAGAGVTFRAPKKERKRTPRDPSRGKDNTEGRSRRRAIERGDVARLKKAGYLMEG